MGDGGPGSGDLIERGADGLEQLVHAERLVEEAVVGGQSRSAPSSDRSSGSSSAAAIDAGPTPDELRARGVRTADELPDELVYAGFWFGEMIAQQLAQTRPGARGALLFYSCIPITGEWAFGPWPDGVPVQIHGMDADPIFVGEGDIDAAREIVEKVDNAELFLYPGDQHYFADSSLASYDPDATALLTRRVLEFLDRV